MHPTKALPTNVMWISTYTHRYNYWTSGELGVLNHALMAPIRLYKALCYIPLSSTFVTSDQLRTFPLNRHDNWLLWQKLATCFHEDKYCSSCKQLSSSLDQDLRGSERPSKHIGLPAPMPSKYLEKQLQQTPEWFSWWTGSTFRLLFRKKPQWVLKNAVFRSLIGF